MLKNQVKIISSWIPILKVILKIKNIQELFYI
jgi:hypothetical protein